MFAPLGSARADRATSLHSITYNAETDEQSAHRPRVPPRRMNVKNVRAAHTMSGA
jgi:hypothetical protein